MPFFHYADDVERMLNFAFYEDSFRYNPFDAMFAQPAIVFQGRHDASVDPRTVEAFADARPNVTLTLLDDDHQLIQQPAAHLGGNLGVPGPAGERARRT